MERPLKKILINFDFMLNDQTLTESRLDAIRAAAPEAELVMVRSKEDWRDADLKGIAPDVEAVFGRLTAEAVDLSHQGMILVGGIATDEEAFEPAQEFQVRGIVVGGLLPELLSHVEKLPFPVIVTEGIGAIPMSGPAFNLLQTNDGREASISGRFQTRWPVIRPEIVIPLPAESLPPSQAQPGMPLTVGAQVRIVRAPHTGASGTVVALPSQRRRTETGAEVYGAEVALSQGPSVFVPLANLEVLR